jgi:hypothetical protein
MWADATECITDICVQHWCCWMQHGWHLNSPFRTFTFQRSVMWKHSGVPANVKVASQVPLGAGGWNLALYVFDLLYFFLFQTFPPFSLLFLYFLWFIVRGCCCCCCCLTRTVASTIRRIVEDEFERFGRKLPWCYVVTVLQFVCNDWRKSGNPAVYTALLPAQFWTRYLRIYV